MLKDLLNTLFTNVQKKWSQRSRKSGHYGNLKKLIRKSLISLSGDETYYQ